MWHGALKYFQDLQEAISFALRSLHRARALNKTARRETKPDEVLEGEKTREERKEKARR